jgi:5'-AMP-activated protein kinase regulatory gamma subunit
MSFSQSEVTFLSIFKRLDTTTIEQLLNSGGDHWVNKRNRSIINISANASVVEAMQVLSSNNILSAPVFDKENDNFLGFVDMMDLLANVVSFYSERQSTDAKQGEEVPVSWCRNIETLKERGEQFAKQPITALIDKSRVDEFCPVSHHGTLFQLMEDVLSQNVHRVPVFDNTDRVYNILSQSDVIRFLYEHIRDIGIARFDTVDKLGLGTRAVISMSARAKAIHAFFLMLYQKVPAVAIVSGNGELVGNLSASDLRGLDQNSFTELLKPVMEFVKSVKRHRGLVTCKTGSTLESVLSKLANNNVHRLWMVDDQNCPVGVVTLTDVMKLFSNREESSPLTKPISASPKAGRSTTRYTKVWKGDGKYHGPAQTTTTQQQSM